jgi:hypothetical protein
MTAEPSPGAGLRGAYGIRITGIADERAPLVEACPHWPHLRIVHERGEPPPRPDRVTDAVADVGLKTGGRLTVERRLGVARDVVPRALSDEELVHPFLAPAATVMAHWHGRLSFHAGAFVAAAGVWGVVGDREIGKSSMLATLALEGHDVVTDDVLVLDDGAACIGPRSIDLRRDAAENLGVGAALGVVGTRERWRVRLPRLDGAPPLRGWFFLGWSDEPQARRLSGSECLTRLIENVALRMTSLNPASLLDVAALPAWHFGRPRDWQRMRESAHSLLSLAC